MRAKSAISMWLRQNAEDDADWDTWEYPEMKTSDFVTQEMIDELVEKKFEGSLPAFIAAFTKRQDLSNDELDEVQQMIDRIRKGEAT